MEYDSEQKEKQNYLRKKIIEKGLDPEKFVEFLQEKKGEEGDDISNWTMEDLKLVVKEFYQINNVQNEENKEKNDNKKEEEDNIKFIIDEDSLMDLFSKKSYKTEEKKKEEQNIPLFNFEKNFPIFEKSQKDNKYKNNNNKIINEDIINKEKEKENIFFNNENLFKFNDNNIENEDIKEEKEEKEIQLEEKKEENHNNNNDDSNSDSKGNIITKNITNIFNSIIKKNSTSKIEPEEDESEYGITMEDTVKCKLMETTEFREHKDIKIEIKDPKKVDTGFFSGKSVNYTIITLPFNYKVERRYTDFKWLREMLLNLFNNILIPKMSYKGKVTKDKHEDNFINKRMRFLEKFINYIIKDETIKTSQILYDFLTIRDYEDFTKKKKEYEKIKVFNFIDIKERKSMDGILNIKINKEKEIYLENIKDNTIYNVDLFKKLNYNFKSLNEELSAVIKRLEIIHDLFKKIHDISIKYLNLKIITESHNQMNIMFKNFAENLNKMKNFINTEIKQHFKFIGNNYISLNEMIQNVELSKNNYLKISKHLIKQKNDIYKKDSSIPKDKIFPEETKNIVKNKMVYGFYLNELIKEYEKMRKMHSYYHKKNISFFCKEQITICSEYTRILGDITMAIDSCTNH